MPFLENEMPKEFFLSEFGSIGRVVVRGLFRCVFHKEALRSVFPWSLPNGAGIRLSVKAVFLSVIRNGQEKKGALRLPSFFAFLRLYSTINLCVVLFFPLIIAMV